MIFKNNLLLFCLLFCFTISGFSQPIDFKILKGGWHYNDLIAAGFHQNGYANYSLNFVTSSTGILNVRVIYKIAEDKQVLFQGCVPFKYTMVQQSDDELSKLDMSFKALHLSRLKTATYMDNVAIDKDLVQRIEQIFSHQSIAYQVKHSKEKLIFEQFDLNQNSRYTYFERRPWTSRSCQ